MNVSAATVLYRELVFDLDLYPRNEIDKERVGVLQDALEANGDGATSEVLAELIDRERVEHLRDILATGGLLPPIVVDKTTRKVIDGFHRSRAYFAWRGPAAAIPCMFHDYEDKRAMFLDAIRLNASHGKPLTRSDQTRCVALAEMLNVRLEDVASVLNVRLEKVAALGSVSSTRATSNAVQPVRPINARGHAQQTSGRGHVPHRHTPPLGSVEHFGLLELNDMIRAIQGYHLDMREQKIRETTRLLVKVALERLKETDRD